MKYTTILFDFDGCIANTLPIWLESFRNVFKELQIEISDRDIIDKAFHMWGNNYDLGIGNKQEFSDKLDLHFANLSKDLTAHEAFEDTMNKLRRRNIKTAVVSSGLKQTVYAKLQLLNIDHYFDTILAWEDTDKNKPDPEPLFVAMKRLNSIPSETIMIGDNAVDIIAAQQAGTTSVWYYPSENQIFYPNNMFAKLNPTHTISHFNELLDLV